MSHKEKGNPDSSKLDSQRPGKRPLGFSKELRIRKTAEFDRVYQGNVYAADQMLVIQAQPNQLSYCRLGVSVSRKFGNAVRRNRWKRLIREAFRLNQNRLDYPVDLVVRPRKGATPDFAAINRSLVRLYDQVCRRLEQEQAKAKPGRIQS